MKTEKRIKLPTANLQIYTAVAILGVKKNRIILILKKKTFNSSWSYVKVPKIAGLRMRFFSSRMLVVTLLYKETAGTQVC